MVNLAIIIINFNTEELILRCLESIFKYKSQSKFEVWVVDNNSTDNSVSSIKKHFSEVNLIESNENLGFAGGNNLALKKVEANYYLLLNSDTEVKNQSIDNLVKFAASSDFGICSCQLTNSNGGFQPNGGELPAFFPVIVWLSGLDDIFNKFIKIRSYQARNKDYYFDKMRIGWVSGSVMLIKKEVIKKIGLLDEKIFMYGEDVEYCYRAKNAGYKIGWTNQAEMVHIGGASSKTPRYNQWMGEFKGLLYIYNKFLGLYITLWVKVLFYFFILARIIGFFIFGKISYSRTYAKIFINL